MKMEGLYRYQVSDTPARGKHTWGHVYLLGTMSVPRVLFQVLSPYTDSSMVSQHLYDPEVTYAIVSLSSVVSGIQSQGKSASGSTTFSNAIISTSRTTFNEPSFS